MSNTTELDDDVPYEKLMAMLSEGDDEAAADTVAFGTTSEPEASLDIVPVDQGVDILDASATEKREAAKVSLSEAKAKDDEGADPPQDAKADTDKGKQDAQPEAEQDEYAALLDGLTDDRKGQIRERLTAADEVMGIFKGRESELERHGVKPAEVMTRLIQLNEYATRNPTDYLAWAATQLGNPQEVLAKAAERLGLKLTAQAAEDPDPFEDPQVREMREKLAAYEARDRAPQLGPDSPHVRAQSELEALAAASPHWDKVAPFVAAQAKAFAEANGKPPTIEDVRRFYRGSLVASGLDTPAQITPAAQLPQPVAQQPQKQPAAQTGDVQRAKAASKSLDGSGQGAGRRPALGPDASIEQILGSLMPR